MEGTRALSLEHQTLVYMLYMTVGEESNQIQAVARWWSCGLREQRRLPRSKKDSVLLNVVSYLFHLNSLFGVFKTDTSCTSMPLSLIPIIYCVIQGQICQNPVK